MLGVNQSLPFNSYVFFVLAESPCKLLLAAEGIGGRRRRKELCNSPQSRSLRCWFMARACRKNTEGSPKTFNKKNGMLSKYWERQLSDSFMVPSLAGILSICSMLRRSSSAFSDFCAYSTWVAYEICRVHTREELMDEHTGQKSLMISYDSCHNS